MVQDRPTFSVSFGWTHSPKQFESIRFDVGYQGIYTDGSNIQEVMSESRPFVEMAVGRLMSMVEEHVGVAKGQLYEAPPPPMPRPQAQDVSEAPSLRAVPPSRPPARPDGNSPLGF